MAICWQIRRQNLIPRFFPANQPTSKSRVQRMEGGRARGGANFLCLSPEFVELHRHKQARRHTHTQTHTHTERGAWPGVELFLLQFPPLRTQWRKKTLFWCESWNEFTACFLHICLSVFFFFLTVSILPRSPRSIPLVCQPPPPLPPTPHSPASSPADFCMHCRAKCVPAAHAAAIYHDASPRSLGSRGPKPTPSPRQPSCNHLTGALKLFSGSAWNPWMRCRTWIDHFC